MQASTPVLQEEFLLLTICQSACNSIHSRLQSGTLLNYYQPCWWEQGKWSKEKGMFFRVWPPAASLPFSSEGVAILETLLPFFKPYILSWLWEGDLTQDCSSWNLHVKNWSWSVFMVLISFISWLLLGSSKMAWVGNRKKEMKQAYKHIRVILLYNQWGYGY